MRFIFLLPLLLTYSCSLSSFASSTTSVESRVVFGKNDRDIVVLDASSFAKPNTKYIVRGNCSLNGAKIRVGSNCKIVLDGGRLCDGEIVGDDTYIKVTQGSRLLSKLSFSGTFLMPVIKSDFFEVDETTLCDIFDLTSDKIKNKVIINDSLSATIPDEWHGAVITKSYTDIIINATVSLSACSFKGGNVFYVRDCHDITINGTGHIVGDLMTHDGNDGESIYAIFIRNAENITVKKVTCEFFWGDGIYIYPGPVDKDKNPVCRNILIDGVTCNSNRRQGISVVGGEKIVIKNSKLLNTGVIRGTAPSSGIDIEPAKGWTVDNIVIDNCEFENNGNATNYPADLQIVNNYGKVILNKCKLNNFFYGCADNIFLKECIISGRFYTSSNGLGKNVRITKSKVGIIHNNLIKYGNVKLVKTIVGD